MSMRVKLIFPEQLVREPVLAQIVKLYGVEPNIRRANVEEHSGWIVCELGGEAAEIERAIAHLENSGVAVERLSDVVEG